MHTSCLCPSYTPAASNATVAVARVARARVGRSLCAVCMALTLDATRWSWSAEVCPSSTLWAGKGSVDTLHNATEECGHAGFCQRSNGECSCLDGYNDHACSRRT